MTSLLRSIHRFLGSNRLERRVILKALLVTPRIARSLKRRGYAGTRAWLQELGSSPKVGAELSDYTLMKADKSIRQMPWDMRCLERSLAIWWIAGNGAVIRLGVAPGTPNEAHRFHAWVERDGHVLNDSPDVANEFLPLAAHPVAPTRAQMVD